MVKGEGETLKAGAKASILFAVTLADGTEVANNFSTKSPLHLEVGAEQSIEGVEIALTTMCYGEKCRLVVTYEYGFGKYDNPHGFHGSNKLIPARSTLFFELHLLNPNMAVAKTSASWLSVACSQKDSGNTAFGQKNYDDALKHYNKALEMLINIKKNLDRPIPTDLKPEQLEESKRALERDISTFKTLKVAIHSNMAACYLQKKEYSNAKDACISALEIEPQNSKALWRYSRAYRGVDDYLSAMRVLSKADPTPEITKELQTLQILQAQKDKRDQKVFGGFFDKLGSEGLYEEKKPSGPPQWKCHLCGEEMDQIQQARHIIKKHSPPNKNKF
eukprot:TRINITY_DN4384_c0_g1_i2.p1 TRINITY_DN4384_c0_g1~~TRINITY_DN4384_c0_g1_i2.p1  ORF type:complete len:376 (-),score=67.82 TRINITY_DN4384_c0_g1_i2:9-1007(-)